MVHVAQSSGRLVISLATDRDRQIIYRLRHEIYARELGQQEENPDGVLTDPFDAFNTYVVASLDGEIAGFISVTPPGGPTRRYSIEDHLPLADLPFPVDDGLYEYRWLTVVEPYRERGIASLMMYAALRWIEGRGGRRVVAVGRPEIEGIYLKAGLQPFVRRVRAGAVTLELLTATVEALRLRADRQAHLTRLIGSAEWRLDSPSLSGSPGPRPAQGRSPDAAAAAG